MAWLLVLVPVLVLSALLCRAASGSTKVRVKPGEDVTLKCQSDDVNIRAAEWTRSDLEDTEYVLFYTDGHSVPTNQDSSFRGRVQLVDKDLKTGDVSLILKNVSRNDEGTYECRVVAGGSSRQKRDLIENEPISIIQLQVSASGKQQADKPDKELPDGDQNRGTPPSYTGLGAAAGSTNITVKTGQDVILPCQSDDVNIRAAEWTRPDLDPEYVLLCRDGHSETPHQHSSFRGRVQLVDEDLKTGNVSLILRNVSRNDEGTYECRVPADGSSRKKRGAIDDYRTISIVQLQVSDSGNQQSDEPDKELPDGDQNRGTPPSYTGLGAAAGLVGLVVVVAVGLFLAWKRRRQPDHRPEPSSEPLSPPAEAVQV